MYLITWFRQFCPRRYSPSKRRPRSHPLFGLHGVKDIGVRRTALSDASSTGNDIAGHEGNAMGIFAQIRRVLALDASSVASVSYLGRTDRSEANP
jgi:hypothetical protein